jgi:anti-sigma factor RsiW
MTTVADLSCDAAAGLVADYVSGELLAGEREAVAGHLTACPVCHARAAFEQALRDQIRALGTEPVPVTLLERVRSISGREV